jgi:SAM-dependent methyltransferase
MAGASFLCDGAQTMSTTSAEKTFYQRHYNGEIDTQKSIDVAQVYADLFAPGRRYHLIEEIIPQLALHGTLLELGCSSGQAVRYLAEKHQFQKSIGIDIAFDKPVAISGAPAIEFMPANLNDALPFADQSIDLLVAMMVIEHLFDPFQAFSEVRRLLSAHGVAVINLPLVTSLKNRLRLLAGELPITSEPFARWMHTREWDGNHLHYFSVASIHHLSAGCGLKVVATSAVGRFHRIKGLWPSGLASELTFALKRT